MTLTFHRYMILTYNTSLQVYSAVDSLLVRRIAVSTLDTSAPQGSTPATIVATRLSKQDPDFVWVACSDGSIYRLNWTIEKAKLESFQTASKTAKSLVVVPATNTIGEAAIVAESDKTTRIELVAYDWKPSSKPSSKSLVSLKKPGSGLQLLESSADGQVLTGAINDRLFIAVAKSEPLQYDFYSFDTQDLITTVDMRVYKRSSAATKKGKNEPETVVDIIAGGARGGIYLYHDAVARCQAAEKGGQNSESIHAQKYHWHRKAVHSVKWSRDGMYYSRHMCETNLTDFRQLHDIWRF